MPSRRNRGCPGRRPRAGLDAAPRAGLDAAPFHLGDLFGYVSPGGALAHLERAPYQVTIAPTGYVAYGRLDTDWILRGPNGDSQGAYSSYGYPLLGSEGKRLLVVKTDLSGIQELAPTGDILWSRDFPAPVTSASAEADLTAAGLLNGSLMVLDRQGAVVLDARPGPSRIRVIYGVSLSQDGRLLAAVSGIDPQRITIWRRSDSGFGVFEARDHPYELSTGGARLVLSQRPGAAPGGECGGRRLPDCLGPVDVASCCRVASGHELSGPENTVAITAGSDTSISSCFSSPRRDPSSASPYPSESRSLP